MNRNTDADDLGGEEGGTEAESVCARSRESAGWSTSRRKRKRKRKIMKRKYKEEKDKSSKMTSTN